MGKSKDQPQSPSNSDLFSLLREATGQDDFGFGAESAEGQSEAFSPIVAQRRQEILEAALKVFAKKGFDGSRTKEIAKEAGTSEATVFKYFPTKRNLLMSIMKPVVTSVAKPFFIAPMTKIIDNAASQGLEQTIILILHDRYELMSKNERLIRTLLLELGRQEDLLAIFRQLVIPMIQIEIERLFTGARERGEIALEIHPNVFARNLLATVLGNIVFTKVAPEQFMTRDFRTEIAESIHIFIHGVQGGKK